ncbi:MAG: four helix bundle protein [Verrucomicrobiota bacterium]|nr:four helix bundle protein [Verrucomicrobiota bacterium]
MKGDELKERTKQFALRIMKLVDALPNTVAGRVIANQIMRSGSSVSANYRAACRARSNAEFISKLGIVLEEADETEFWIELIIDGELLPNEKVEALKKEAEEITAIMASSRKTAQNHK